MQTEEIEMITFADFLENSPPNQMKNISDIAARTELGFYLNKPNLQLHCSSEKCNGVRIFRSNNASHDIYDILKFDTIFYTCSNCHENIKVFSLQYKMDNTFISGLCNKLGEVPPFGPSTPSRLISLIGPDRDMFLKGRRCENQGLGVGAFAYYRRVVENQRDRILNQIIKVLETVKANPDDIAKYKAALKENQFSKSIDMVKDSIPQGLLINGHNPLSLLHGALSRGLHDKSDEHCLEIATSIRVILAELSEKLSAALKDEEEIKKAIAKLLPQ